MSGDEIEIPEKIMQVFDDVFGYASHVDDWLVIKKSIVFHVRPELRSLFSRRHKITKLQQTNDFERKLIGIWESRTGRPMVLPKQHDDSYLDEEKDEVKHI